MPSLPIQLPLTIGFLEKCDKLNPSKFHATKALVEYIFQGTFNNFARVQKFADIFVM